MPHGILAPCVLALALGSDPQELPLPFGPQLVDLPMRLIAPRLGTCDLDGDGVQEVLVAGGKSVLLHGTPNDTGGLHVVSVPLPMPARHAIGADLDGDGLDEIVVAGDLLLVVPSEGGPSQLGTSWPAAQGKHARVAAADLDGDGDLDLIATANDGVRTYANDGTHGFQLMAQLQDGTEWALLGECDLDGDGVPDLVGARTNAIRVRRGDGSGGWLAPTDFALAQANAEIHAGDVDGDGTTDLVVRGPGTLAFPRVLLGVGDGTLTEGPSLAGTYLPTEGVGLAALELDDDPACEILVCDAIGTYRIDDASDELRLTRWPVSTTREFAALRGASGEVAHLIGLVQGNSLAGFQWSWGLSVMDRRTIADAGGFLDALPSTGPLNWSPLDADLNGDGHLDRLTGSAALSGTSVRLGSPQGWTGGEYELPAGTVASDALDLDGDGDLDLLGATYAEGELHMQVHPNVGSGRFPDGVRYGPGFGSNAWPSVLGDLDGDGREDVGVTSAGAFVVLLSLGDGDVAIGAELPGLGHPSVVADLDLDGHLDLLFSSFPSGLIAFGDGRGGVRAPIPAPHVDGVANLFLDAADLDGDGLPELVTRAGTMFQAQIAVFPALGNATWGPPRFLGSYSRVKNGQVADLDGDGLQDLLLGTDSGPLLLRNDGDGGLLPWLRLAWRVPQVTVHDVDGDGRPELLGADGIVTRCSR